MNGKQFIRVFARWRFIRFTVHGVLKLQWAVSRAYSHLRFMALVEKTGDSVCHWTVEIKYPENLRIGDQVAIGPMACLGAKNELVLEDLVRISRGAVIETAGLDLSGPPPYPHVSKPITIRRGAWIGTNAIVLGGVTVGEFAVIGAGAVVTKDVPPYGVVVGASTRVWTRKADES